MFGAIAGGIASALAGGAMSKLFGGGQKAASGGIQGDVLATDNNTVGMGDAGIKSAIQGSNVPNPDEARPLLVMRSNLWASGYDVDGTDQTSLGQFSGRVQQTYKHSVPRFFVPEHGTMFTLALVRFPPTATKEI